MSWRGRKLADSRKVRAARAIWARFASSEQGGATRCTELVAPWRCSGARKQRVGLVSAQALLVATPLERSAPPQLLCFLFCQRASPEPQLPALLRAWRRPTSVGTVLGCTCGAGQRLGGAAGCGVGVSKGECVHQGARVGAICSSVLSPALASCAPSACNPSAAGRLVLPQAA